MSEITLKDKLTCKASDVHGEELKLFFNVHHVGRDKDGNIEYEKWTHNQVQTAGKSYVADALSLSPASSVMSHMAIGTSTGQGPRPTPSCPSSNCW